MLFLGKQLHQPFFFVRTTALLPVWQVRLQLLLYQTSFIFPFPLLLQYIKIS